jgi:antitoxin HicB
MALEYPVRLIPDDNNTIRVEFLDFPEANTFGDDREEALSRAVGALETVVEAYIRDRRPIPSPRAGRARDVTVALPAIAGVKVALYRDMLQKGLTKSAIARALNWHLPQVDRLLDIRHESRIDQLNLVAGLFGKRIGMTLESAAIGSARGATRATRTRRTRSQR